MTSVKIPDEYDSDKSRLVLVKEGSSAAGKWTLGLMAVSLLLFFGSVIFVLYCVHEGNTTLETQIKGLIAQIEHEHNENALHDMTGARVVFLGQDITNCGADTDPVKISQLSLSPYPIVLPGNVSAAFLMTLGQDLVSKLPFSIRIKKKEAFVWVDIPCFSGIGSCDYDDWCTHITTFFNPCPETLEKLGLCTCPYKAGSYQVPMTQFASITQQLPSILTSGQYKITIQLKDASGNRLVCGESIVQVQAQ